MKLSRASRMTSKFDVLTKSRTVQVAMMTLKSGDASDEALRNEHPRSEQWLYVIAGTGRIRVATSLKRSRSQTLKAGDVLLIEKGERHQVKNTGTKPLRTINFYSPPAYDDEGEVKKTAKRS